MPSVKKVAGKVQLEIERFDGGLNTKDSPSRIDVFESPDCLNVTYDAQGSVQTREGTEYLNTSVVEVGTNVFDGVTEYNGSMVAWAGGSMLYKSGTTFVTVPSAQGQFASGAKVAYEQYQGVLFCSDGTNGPWRYEAPDSFYNMGIYIPSAPTAKSDGAGDIAADTYYYAVSYINTHVVEGEVGSASVAAILIGSAQVLVDSIPVGSSLQGVDDRNVYRATSATGPWLFVKSLGDNTTTSFTDTVGVGSEGSESVADGTSPTPFTTVKLHRERLFFDDSSNRTLLRWTDFQSPYISAALNFEPLNKGDGSNILGIGVQDGLISVGKTQSIWLVNLADPSDDSTWSYLKSPANQGFMGARAFLETRNGIFFLGQRNGLPTGFHLLSGIDVMETANQVLRTRSISEKIEPNVLSWSASLTDDVSMIEFKNKIMIGVPASATSTRIDGLMWFDLNRLGTDGQPGSWSPWSGFVGANDFVVFDGDLYGASSDTDGHVFKFYDGTYEDADGSAIDSYFWTKQYGGEAAIESWIKDWRHLNVWYYQLGAWMMNMAWKIDNQVENSVLVDLTPDQNVWGNAGGAILIWAENAGDDGADKLWAGDIGDMETQHPVGPAVGRRIQVKFDNQNIVGQGFKVHSLKALMGLRRQR